MQAHLEKAHELLSDFIFVGSDRRVLLKSAEARSQRLFDVKHVLSYKQLRQSNIIYTTRRRKTDGEIDPSVRVGDRFERAIWQRLQTEN